MYREFVWYDTFEAEHGALSWGYVSKILSHHWCSLVSTTLPETNSSHLKIDHPKGKIVFQPSSFSGAMLVLGGLPWFVSSLLCRCFVFFLLKGVNMYSTKHFLPSLQHQRPINWSAMLENCMHDWWIGVCFFHGETEAIKPETFNGR